MVKEDVLFPYSKIRESQKEMIVDIDKAVKDKKNIIVHAPTGLGKTVASLGPALKAAIEKNLTVFFLTSRHTQHMIAIETLTEIKKKYKLDFGVVDIVGKRWMCNVPGIEKLYSNEFSEFCKSQRENDKCEFYSNTKTKNKLSVKAKKILEDIKSIGPCHSEKVVELCNELCPYEISTELAKKAKVVVTDYYYIFNPKIRNTFFTKTSKELENSILIIDEAHNLPNRVRDLMTDRLSNFIVSRAIKEAKKYGYEEITYILESIKDILDKFAAGTEEECLIKKEELVELVNGINDYEQIINDLKEAGNEIREKQKQSYVGSVGVFLESWLGEDEGFTRILTKKQMKRDELIILSYRCLDPALITSDVINNAHSSILMSGTLTPTSMYKKLLGIDKCEEKEYKSPFPEENRLNLIIPKTTTKFTKRNEEQYKNIAGICCEVVNAIPGNCVVFFPSYDIRDKVDRYFSNCRKSVFYETPNLSKKEKIDLLERFKEYKDVGAVLLSVISGSFGEGIDLPGDLLKGVVIVGLPLSKPDLETKELIKYFDLKFSKGWDYGYLYPAFNKCLQSAGRCIRSETDRGVVIFLEERFTWPNYFGCFPSDLKLKISLDYVDKIKEFFGEKN